MKFQTTVFLLALSLPFFARAECDKWEYARLKDADTAELNNRYCATASQAILARKMATNRSESGDDLAAAEKMEIQSVCMEQLEQAEAMLRKKFKSKPTASCASRYKAEVLDYMPK